MRFHRFLFILLLIPLFLSAQKQVKLDINLKGLNTTDTLTIAWAANNKSMNPLISQKNATEICSFTLPVNEPRLIILGLKGYQNGYEILITPEENIEITGRIRIDNSGKKPEAYFTRMHVKGASQQSEYQNILRNYNAHLDSIDNVVFNEYKDINRLIEKAKQNDDEQAIADMYKTINGQSYIERVMSTYQERNDFLWKTVSEHSDSYMAPLLLLRLAGRLDKSYRPLYDKMSDAAKQSYYGREVNDEVNPPTMIDDFAPTLQLMNKQGSEELISLAQHGNKYLLIDFWASWCEPCRKEMPNLMRLYTKYHDKGLEMVSISADRDADEWLKAIDEIGQPWQNYLDNNRQGIAEYKVQYIPSIFIVDSKGKIISEKLRGKDLTDFVDSLFQ